MAVAKRRELASETRGATAYDADYYTWAMEQAQLLKAGRLESIDAANLAEEIEGLARTEFRTLVSAYRLILMHMLKWDYQTERRTVGWVTSIKTQRLHAIDELADNPGLRPRTDEALVRAYTLARIGAASQTELPEAAFPSENPYSLDEIMDRPFEWPAA